MATSDSPNDAFANQAKNYCQKLVFYVNQERHEILNPDPRILLVDYLRSTEVGLTGTKHSCGQGGCGACTVTLSHYDQTQRQVVHRACNSCLHPLAALDGMQVTTVEGLGSVNTEVSPVQFEIAKNNGSQCGYCTPGFVMNMHSYLLQKEGCELSAKDIENAFDGNICRCTGFRPILYAMKKHFASDHDEEEQQRTPDCHVDPSMAVRHYDKPRDNFPSELKEPPRSVAYQHTDHFQRNHFWFRPLCLSDLHQLMHNFRKLELKLVVGNTTLGIPGINPRHSDVQIDVSHIAELHEVKRGSDHLVVGAAVSYTEFLGILDEMLISASDTHKVGLAAIHYMAQRTAGTIVRNMASLAGNTMLVVRNATGGTPFPSDVFTALLSLDAQIVVQTMACEPEPMALLEFVRKYNDASDPSFREHAVILRYHIPYTTTGDHLTTYKVALREVNSHSLVNAGLRVNINDEGIIQKATIVFGAITPVAFRAEKTEDYLQNKPWNRKTYEGARKILTEEIREIQSQLPDWFLNLPYDGIAQSYRLNLAESYFYKFYVEVSGKIDPSQIPAPDRSAGVRYKRPVSKGSQTYHKPREGTAIGQPIIKLSAFEQATGEAIYTHDIPLPVRGLQGSLVTSTAAKANFWFHLPGSAIKVSIDELVEHLRERFGTGFVDCITARDIPPGGKTGVNQLNSPPDPWFSENSVTCFGQSIALIVAGSKSLATDIGTYVRESCIDYEKVPEDKIVLDMVTAINRNDIFPNYDNDDNHSLQTPGYKNNSAWVGKTGIVEVNDSEGNPVRCEAITGTQHTGFQIHFYMETQSAVAIPGEGPEILIHPSTQDPDSIQGDVQQTLSVQANQVEVSIKRIGGGYGGKTTRPPFVAVPTALAAAKLQRPVRVALPRDIDSWTIGSRHPFMGKYNMAIASEGTQRGKIMGASTSFHSNGGNTLDCSWDVMDCAQLGADNTYNVPYFFSEGQVCITNVHSNNAMRSYGSIQAMLIQEDALEKAANQIGMLPETVREMNFYKNGDTTPFGQKLEYCYIDEVWQYLKKKCDFDTRVQEVNKFNTENRWRKRGISMIPLKYGMGYNLGYLMQGGAHVDIFTTDGTVLVQVGGVEMGQGIFTKVAQVSAYELNVPLGLVRMGSTQTSVVPDPVSTGATSGTDLCGGAAKDACQQLRQDLEQLCEKLKKEKGNQWCKDNGINFWDYKEGWQTNVIVKGQKKKTLMWNCVVNQAYQHRVGLSAQSLYTTPGLDNAKDQQFYGFTYSAACSEVEIDVLTGETTVLRSDICYDVGQSINPAIDIGQVEGAFVMGIGYVLTEDLIFEPDGPDKGRNNTPNTWTYKLPATTTIPIEMNIELFPRDKAKVTQNPNLLIGSKGVGEPPLVLSASVYFAAKHAVLAARKQWEKPDSDWFEMPLPATVQRIREACYRPNRRPASTRSGVSKPSVNSS